VSSDTKRGPHDALRVRVIVADPDPEIAVELERVVGHRWQVIHASSDVGAIRELRRGGADALVVEYDVGRRGGPAVAEAARSFYPEPAVVMVAKRHSPARETTARAAGVLSYEPKPVPVGRLVQLVTAFISSRRRLAVVGAH
jgi:DNA-binding NarL/FixJ family response regulator